MVSRGANKVLNYSTAANKGSAPVVNKSSFGNIVLHPSLQRRIEHLARATSNTKSHQAPFRNMMFYGPPGTGKTMVAREIARKSVKNHSFSFCLLFLYMVLYVCALWHAFMVLFDLQEAQNNCLSEWDVENC